MCPPPAKETTNESRRLVGGFLSFHVPSTTTNESSRLVGGPCFSPTTMSPPHDDRPPPLDHQLPPLDNQPPPLDNHHHQRVTTTRWWFPQLPCALHHHQRVLATRWWALLFSYHHVATSRRPEYYTSITLNLRKTGLSLVLVSLLLA